MNNTCILARERVTQKEKERGKTERQPERTERESMNGLGATLLALTKGGRGTITSQHAFPLIITNCVLAQIKTASAGTKLF